MKTRSWQTRDSTSGRWRASSTEFEAVRRATIAQFEAFLPGRSGSAPGNASGKQMSVRALAWVIAGHELHHLGILRERYA
jgi:hypothetical protein